MPNFTWDLGPIAFEIPKGPLLMVVGAIALIMLITGLVRKENDLTVFGLFVGAVLALASGYLPDPIGLRYYSLLFVGVFLGGYALLHWQIRRGGGPEEAAGDFIVYGVLGVLIGARLGHVLFYDLDHALEDPLWVFQIWTGGLASHGAVIGLIIAMWLFTRRRGVPFLEGADRFAFAAALGATLVRLGNFFNSEIVGRVVDDQSWGVRFPRYDHQLAVAPLRYPTQLFEFGMGLLVLLSLWLVDRAAGKENRPRGLLISTFFLVYFTGRFVVEFYKEYQALEPTSTLTMGQVLSIPGFLIGVGGVIWSLKERLPVGWPNEEEEDDEEYEDEDEGDEDEDEGDEERAGGDPDVDAEWGGSNDEKDDDERDERDERDEERDEEKPRGDADDEAAKESAEGEQEDSKDESKEKPEKAEKK